MHTVIRLLCILTFFWVLCVIIIRQHLSSFYKPIQIHLKFRTTKSSTPHMHARIWLRSNINFNDFLGFSNLGLGIEYLK